MAFIARGAEAVLERETFADRYFPSKDLEIDIVVKKRIKKGYRNEKIDRHLRESRTVAESRLIHEAKKCVRTPTIFEIDTNECSIIMECIEGDRVKELLETLTPEERGALCRRIGEAIGSLHYNGIIHGDLTTSNMICRSGEIYLIDFGLGEFSGETENQGVDLHLLKEALQSTHHAHFTEDFAMVMEGYGAVVGNEKRNEIVKKIEEIERRGRYVKRGSLRHE